MTSFGFDVSNTKPQMGFDPLPDGWYDMTITSAELATSKGGNQYIKVCFEVEAQSHPQFAGRKVFGNFNHLHPNAQTREIAQSQISAMCHSVGKPNATMIEDLLGGQLKVRVVAKPPENGYDARNEAKAFKPLADAPSASAPSKTAAPTSAPASKRGAWK